MIGTDSANSAEPDQAPQITVSDKVMYTEICLFTECILNLKEMVNYYPYYFRYGFVQLIRANIFITHKCA